MAESQTRNVGLVGGVSLLLTSITGPGLVILPYVFQQSGWVLPSLAIVAIGVLSAVAGLFVVEAVSRFPGNDAFERNVEFTVMVHQFYGRYWYYAFIFVLYGSLQSVNIASIVGSAQAFDSIFVGIFGGTCGLGIAPLSGIYCVTETIDSNSPFGSNYMLVTLGYLVVIAIVIPLTTININDNILLQFASVIYNVLFVLTLLGQGAIEGYKSSRLKPVGTTFDQIVGTILFNFTLANTIPSWMNIRHAKVSPHKTVWYTTILAIALFIITGILGALAYEPNFNSNLLQTMYSSKNLTNGGKGWITFIYILFPILTYLTSIPVAMIIVRLNFLAARVCDERNTVLIKETATFFAVTLPILIGIPLQTGSLVNYFGTYTSVVFQSSCNFLAPFLIFLFLSKRNTVMAQSVIDELQFLDINAGTKKVIREDEDDFDYIYQYFYFEVSLPHADPSRIFPRDPFASTNLVKTKGYGTKQSIMELSNITNHSINNLRSMLDPTIIPTKNNRKRSFMGAAPDHNINSSSNIANKSLGTSQATRNMAIKTEKLDMDDIYHPDAVEIRALTGSDDYLPPRNFNGGNLADFSFAVPLPVGSEVPIASPLAEGAYKFMLEVPVAGEDGLELFDNNERNSNALNGGHKPSHLFEGIGELSPVVQNRKRSSVAMDHHTHATVPSVVSRKNSHRGSVLSRKGSERASDNHKQIALGVGALSMEEEINFVPFKDYTTFRALPVSFTRFVSARHVAILGIVLTCLSVLQVILTL